MADKHPDSWFPTRSVVLVGIILAAAAVGAASRLLPYAVSTDSPLYLYVWNFTPVFALALFGGACFQSRWAACLVPLLAMGLSDVVLHVTELAPVNFTGRAVVYALFLATVGMGVCLRPRRTAGAIAGMAVASALLFYVVTNFGAWVASADVPLPSSAPASLVALVPWAFTHEAFLSLPPGYPKTVEGLLACFILGLPFLRNMILGNLVYSFVLFGGLALVERRFPALREADPVAGTAAC
jgi:hypothetical protein